MSKYDKTYSPAALKALAEELGEPQLVYELMAEPPGSTIELPPFTFAARLPVDFSYRLVNPFDRPEQDPED